MKRKTKKYSIIYADPPWFYNARNNPKNTKFGFGACGHYPVMKTPDICNLDIGRMCNDNSVLFLWSTMPRLPDALEVMSSWGFEYKTVGFSWLKTNKDGSPWFGIGYYTKSNLELCLLGVRGKMKPVSNHVSQVILEPRGRHSQKPVIVRDKIVELFGDLDRIELFAREQADGWDAWGNEIENPITHITFKEGD